MQYSIKAKFIAAFLLVSLIPLIALGFINYLTAVNSLTDARKDNLKQLVEGAYILAENLNKQVTTGKLTKEEAQEMFRIGLDGPKQADKTRKVPEQSPRIGRGDYFFAYNKELRAVMHPKSFEGEIKNDPNVDGVYVNKEIYNQKNGFYSFMWQNPGETTARPKIAYMKYFEAWDWVIVMGSYYDDFSKEATSIKKTNTVIILLGTAIIVLVSFLISRRFANQVEHVKQVVETMGIGNFTKQVKVRTRDEIGKMGTSLNTAIAQIANIISEVKTTSEFVSKSTVSLAEGAAQLKQTSKEIAGSVEEVASGAEKQSNNVQELSSYMEELSASFEETSTNVTKVSQIAAQTQEASKTGKVHIDQSVQQMGIIDQSVQEIEQVMNRLDERTKEIHKFTAVITEIASQTNLLALNAAIEAARAGEQGRGFAVVAGEVKKLAEQSSRSADEIRNILTNILEESDRSQTTVKLGSNAVKKGISVIEQTGQSFDEIYASVAQVAVELDKISLSIDEVNKGAQDVTKSVVELGTFNEEASTHTQNVAASVEEQTVMTNEIYVAVQAMAEKVQQLNELGKKFTI